MPELTKDTLTAFLNNLPSALSIEREAGLARGHLAKIKAGKRPLTEATKSKLTPVLERYGYK